MNNSFRQIIINRKAKMAFGRDGSELELSILHLQYLTFEEALLKIIDETSDAAAWNTANRAIKKARSLRKQLDQ